MLNFKQGFKMFGGWSELTMVGCDVSLDHWCFARFSRDFSNIVIDSANGRIRISQTKNRSQRRGGE